MKPIVMTINSAALALCLMAAPLAQADPDSPAAEPVWDLAAGLPLFDDFALDRQWRQRWGIPWMQRGEDARRLTAEEIPAGAAGLLVTYPEGAVGPSDGGLQFPVSFARIAGLAPAYEQLYLTYYVYFDEGFDFRLGGKLPGLMGEGDSWGRSGGDQPDGNNGWTLRLMWRPEGRAVVYSYLPPSDHGKYGDSTWGLDMDMDRNFFEPGRWYRIDQYVRVNDHGRENGHLKMWLDGRLVLDLDDVTYQRSPDGRGRVGGIFFSTFHGGSTGDWAPAVTSRARFAGFAISTDKPDMQAARPE